MNRRALQVLRARYKRLTAERKYLQAKRIRWQLGRAA